MVDRAQITASPHDRQNTLKCRAAAVVLKPLFEDLCCFHGAVGTGVARLIGSEPETRNTGDKSDSRGIAQPVKGSQACLKLTSYLPLWVVFATAAVLLVGIFGYFQFLLSGEVSPVVETLQGIDQRILER